MDNSFAAWPFWKALKIKYDCYATFELYALWDLCYVSRVKYITHVRARDRINPQPLSFKCTHPVSTEVYRCQKKKRPILAMNLDMSKYLDRVVRVFLFTLHSSHIYTTYICSYIETTLYTIIVQILYLLRIFCRIPKWKKYTNHFPNETYCRRKKNNGSHH